MVYNSSVKLYYNPINGKFEPIGYDGHRLVPNFSEYIINDKPILNETNFSIAKKKINSGPGSSLTLFHLKKIFLSK